MRRTFLIPNQGVDLSQFWSGRSIFYLKGKAPTFSDGQLKDSANFLSRPIPAAHDGRRPASANADDWASMNHNEREGYKEEERRMREEKGMSSEDDDAGGVHWHRFHILYALIPDGPKKHHHKVVWS